MIRRLRVLRCVLWTHVVEFGLCPRCEHFVKGAR